MKTNIIVRFIQGGISIKRGRVTRHYAPTIRSIHRLVRVLQYGASECAYTQRASVYHWYGRSSLDDTQKVIYDMLKAEWRKGMHFDVDRCITLQDVCVHVDMHPLTIESTRLCEHGNLPSRCITCYSDM
jgi:hypothetical protein